MPRLCSSTIVALRVGDILGPAYGEVSPDGEDHFKVVATKIGEMAAVEP